MTFLCDGKAYDASELDSYDTGDPGTPTVFTTRDKRCVLVLRMNRWTGLEVHQAEEAEIRHLAHRYHIPQLLRLLPARPESTATGTHPAAS